MSEDLHDDGELRIGSYCGPVRADGGDRRRIQLDTGGDPVTLDVEQALTLAVVLDIFLQRAGKTRPS